MRPAARWCRWPSVGDEDSGDETRRLVAWYGEEMFIPHLLQLLSRPSIHAMVSFGEPIYPPHTDRRELCAEAERRVRELGNLPFLEVAEEPGESDQGSHSGAGVEVA